MTKEEAENEKKKGNYVEYEEGDEGYQKNSLQVLSQLYFYEIDAIKGFS